MGYLDDFFLSCDSERECESWQRYLIDFLFYLGFKINNGKVAPPSHSLRYLGIVLEKMMFCLPEDKLSRAEKAIRALLGKKWVPYKSFEKVTGYLAHCATIVKDSRTFCRRMYTAF